MGVISVQVCVCVKNRTSLSLLFNSRRVHQLHLFAVCGIVAVGAIATSIDQAIFLALLIQVQAVRAGVVT